MRRSLSTSSTRWVPIAWVRITANPSLSRAPCHSQQSRAQTFGSRVFARTSGSSLYHARLCCSVFAPMHASLPLAVDGDDAQAAQAATDEAAPGEDVFAKCVRVQRYGLLGPTDARPRVASEMVKAAAYYNALIALERCRREVFRALRREHVPEIDQLEAEVAARRDKLAALREEIKLRKRDKGKGDGASPEVTAALSACATDERTRLFAAKAQLKDARARAREHPGLREAVEALEARAKLWHKGLRRTIAPSWGTYLMVERSIEQAKRAAVDPGFRKVRGKERVSRALEDLGHGSIGVQVQGGMTASELYAGTSTQLALVDAPLSYRRKRTSARGLRRCATKMLRMRVGSDPDRAPIWAEFPCIHHRPLPDGARIKGATVVMTTVGMQERWSVSITYEADAVPLPERAGVVALDLGWRKRPDGRLRVAYWADDRGQHGEITMPARVRERLRKCDDLRSIQDKHFNRVVRGLCRWLPRARHLPRWLPPRTERLDRWRSHARLRSLVTYWRDHRFPGDWIVFPVLERWLHRSRHLAQWEENARDNALRQRHEVYCLEAARIARTYGVVVLERFDLSEQKRLAPPEGGPDAPHAQRVQLHHAAPGAFRTTLTNAAAREGGVVLKLDGAGTTSACHQCGGVCDWDKARDVRHTCEHCGAQWDQDHNAAANLLRQFVRDQGAALPAPVAKKKPLRFAKRKGPRAAE